MIDEITKQQAKDVDINKVIDYFQWERCENDIYKMHCPSAYHRDSTPSCSYNRRNNTVHCFGCGKTFDTINLYKALSLKLKGIQVSFPKAVNEVLKLDGTAISNIVCAKNIATGNNQNNNSSNSYDTVINNSRPLTGYELNYLHQRGIMIYDSYVYKGQVYTKQSIEKALQTETDQQKIQKLKEIEANGRFFNGIAPILKKNKIQIKHNYWQGVNSIIYQIDYDFFEDEELQQYAMFLTDTERHMAVQKTMDDKHKKNALGNADFCWIAEGIGTPKSGDIYITEGLEDSFSYTMNGKKSISLNSVANLHSFMAYLEKNYYSLRKLNFVISFDHDKTGKQAEQELIEFFETWNKQNPKRPYAYSVCKYPDQYHDINDYWKDKVFKK